MKYEKIYRNIRDECGIISNRLEILQDVDMPHKDWIRIEKLKESIVKLRDYLYQFNKKIVEDGCTV